MEREQSATILERLKRSDSVTSWIAERRSGPVERTDANELALSSSCIALEHRQAALFLVEHQARTTAFALMRPIFESAQRAIWALECATPVQLQNALAKGHLPTFKRMTAQVKKLRSVPGIIATGIDSDVDGQGSIWDSLCQFTHGGMLQVDRWRGEQGIEPWHTLDEVLRMLNWLDMYGIYAAMSFAIVASESLVPYTERIVQIRREEINPSL